MKKVKQIFLLALTVAFTNAMGQQTFTVTRISENANTRSDQRPIPIGFYDSTVNKTFVAWMGANSTAVVKALDHKTNQWSTDKIVGVSPFVDKHNYPGLLKGKDQRLYVFYGCHNSTMKMTVSPNPLSIEGTWKDVFIKEAERASYPAPVITSDGTFYVFYRDTRKTNGHEDDRPYQFVKSKDNGKTWTRQMAIDPYPRTTDNMTEVYNGKVTYQPARKGQAARIHLAWTLAGEKLGNHAHATYGRNVYYAWLNPANDHMYNILGKDLGTTIEKGELDQYCLVLDTGIPEKGHLAGLQVSVHFRDNGFPLIYFDNQISGGPGTATWNGKSWEFSQIGQPNNDDRELRDPRELEKTGPESFRVYKPAGNKINVYKTVNAGKTWELETTVPVETEVDRVYVIKDAHDDAKLLITEAGDREIKEAKRDVFIGSVVKSEWVYPGKDGKLVYKTTPSGDKIMDFSHAGYMGGGVPLPFVEVKQVVEPSGEDDTKAIQSAINAVAAMPLNNGFRGAVLLAPGTFTCSGTIYISACGVVLRGSGSGKGGTTIVMRGEKHTAFIISANKNDRSPETNTATENKLQSANAETLISDVYVPSGSKSFHVADAKGFKVGDVVEIIKPITDAWVHLMVMDNLKRDGKPQTWINNNRKLVTTRKITAITGNRLTLDVPLADSYDAKYLNPAGTKVVKVKLSTQITQAGVENLHIQCPPLEIAYGKAPYSGIRVAGNDCWVKDLFFEETMNTAVLEGNRITMQKVVIKHTYPNLGASKPADFSFEGSQNLVDGCESTGGNTYFVWTSSLIPGPNVVLNSTFRGHGSRLQPHQRWATGLLFDNCTILEGNIDFINRGVAGSGHGWTMGWGVAWNNIAKNYIIQNPPGAANWAIGNIGERQQTARLFDSEPILPEGYFDAHNTPVSPQSLYLAQLKERLGMQALKNIGYTSNTVDMFTNKSVQPLSPLLKDTDPVLGENLALHRPVSVSNVRGTTMEFAGERALDGDPNTYWATNDHVTSAVLELDTENPVEISAVELGEVIELGPRVQEYKIEGQVNSDWKLLAQGTTIGERRIDRFPKTTVWKVRITIVKATTYPAIRKVGMYLEKDATVAH